MLNADSKLLAGLQKIAYDLDRARKYSEADKIDAMIKSMCERAGISIIDGIVSLADCFKSNGLEAEASVIYSLIKTAKCPQCGNFEFGLGEDDICEDCGYPMVKMQREPGVKKMINIKPLDEKDQSFEDEQENIKSGETKMFDKLLKLANTLDQMGRHEEADLIDELIKSAADEIEGDPDAAPIDLTEEEDALPMASPEQSPETKRLLEEREQLRKELETLKVQKINKQVSSGIKISTKGAVSLYGLGKWPVTLYAGQWEKLLSKKEEILKFIADHKDFLKIK